MQKPQASSSFSALANVAFSRLWVAALASGTAVAADQTAARWALIHFSESAFVISLLSSTAALPFLLFSLPARFLAGRGGRRRPATVAADDQRLASAGGRCAGIPGLPRHALPRHAPGRFARLGRGLRLQRARLDRADPGCGP